MADHLSDRWQNKARGGDSLLRVCPDCGAGVDWHETDKHDRYHEHLRDVERRMVEHREEYQRKVHDMSDPNWSAADLD
jgi:hypothetical protein